MIDVGAHIVDTALWLAKFAKETRWNKKVVAIDPNPVNISFIKQMVKLNELGDYVVVVNSPVGDQKIRGREILDEGFASNWIEPDINGPSNIQKVDDSMKDIGLDEYEVGFLHLDLEGYEYNALLGSQTIINKFRPMVVVEVFINEQMEKVKEMIYFRWWGN